MERYIRVVFFLQQIVTDLVTKYLESKYLPDNFQTFLLNQRHSLFHLYFPKPCCTCGNNINLPRKQVINEVQFDKLYVSEHNVCSVRRKHSCIYTASSNVNVSELDITLTIAILKNCFTTSLTQQEENWLDNIRKIRNEISHLTITNDISENDFNRMWLTLDNSTTNLANVFQPKNSNDINLRIQQLKNREVLASKNDCMECLQQILLWKSNDENINENLKKILEQLERMEAPRTGILAIQIQQSTFTFTYGSQVVIPCVITASDSIITNVYWDRYSNNDKIQIKNGDSGYQGITPTTPSLIINCVALEDAGIYICHVENANGYQTSYPVTITVNGGLPANRIQKNTFTHTCGSQALIPCTISSDSMITNVYWEKRSNNNNVLINNGDSRYQEPLDISVDPAEANIIQGHNHTIQCTVAGISTATSIEWLFTPNGEDQQSLNIGGSDEKYTGGSTQNPSLTVVNFQPADEGSYVCCASNASGKYYSCPTVLKFTETLDISVDSADANIIQGHNHTIQCTVAGISTATSIEWLFTPNGEDQQSLNIGGSDEKYTGGSTQNPSLTVVNFQPADEGSYVCCASNASGKYYSCPTVLKFTGQLDGNWVETYIYKCIDGMRINGKECRKTALSYSFLVYAALRGSISLGQERSKIFREIAKTLNPLDICITSTKDYLEMKLVPAFLTKVDTCTYSPRDNVVVKSIIHSFGNECIECLLKICRFDILFDHVRLKRQNKDDDFLEVDAFTLANAFFQRIQFVKGDVYLIGQYIRQLGEDINRETLDLFVALLLQSDGDITIYHLKTFLDGLTKEGTDFDVFRKFPKLYDAFYRKVDKYENTICHYIVVLYSKNEKYKLYMQHFCEKKIELLQLENYDKYTAIDFASLLGRYEVIAIVISGNKLNRQFMTKRIFKMITRGVEKWQTTNTGVDNLIKISLNNVPKGNYFDYVEILKLFGNGSDIKGIDDAKRILEIISRNIPTDNSAISYLIELFTGGSARHQRFRSRNN